MGALKKIKLKNLWINTENYRFEPTESQPEAIGVMVENQKDKLYNIAEHIIQNGLNPIDWPIITDLPNHPKKFLVLEGNRRIAALKLLENPSLLNDTSASSSLKKKFQQLHKSSSSKIPETINCVFFNDPTSADKWIKLKHTGENNGVGIVSWDGQQTARYQVKVGEKSSPGLQVIEYLKQSEQFDPSLKSKLANVKVTTLTRLITDKDIQQVLGISIENGQVTSTLPEAEVIKGYTQVVKDLLTKGFTVKKVYTKEQREDYARNFPENARPNSKTPKGEPWTTASKESISPTVAVSTLPKAKKNPTDRTKLIPKECIISISNPKVNKIYDELRRLPLKDYIHAPAALLRVFIELSFDIYIEQHNLTISPSSAKSNTTLYQKGFQIIQHMSAVLKVADAATTLGMRNLLKDKDGILSMETLHAYIHNHRISPTETSLKSTWDGIQDFMVVLWNNIK